tara:strand:+ start:2288 stop:2608 length:321 start_codon:yes stop_codon:yes gene_type:complete
MKKLLFTTLAICALASTPALADHHEGGKMKEKMGMKHDKMFDKHDSNADGVVTKEEFMAHVEEKFNKMDADGNGEITKDESREYYKAKHEEWKEKKGKMKEEKAAE